MKRKLIPLLAVLSMPFPVRAADPTPAPTTAPATQLVEASIPLLSHVQQQLKTINTLEADFVQYKQLAVLKHKMTIRGHFAMEKPDKVIWIVDEPVKYVIRVEGDEVRQWDQDTNKVQVIHLGGDPTFKAISQQIQSWFLGNYKELGDSYQVFVLADKPLSLRFVPKGDSMVSKLVKNIDVTFGADELNIDNMIVHELSGDSTTLQFESPRMNQAISDGTWEVPPK